MKTKTKNIQGTRSSFGKGHGTPKQSLSENMITWRISLHAILLWPGTKKPTTDGKYFGIPQSPKLYTIVTVSIWRYKPKYFGEEFFLEPMKRTIAITENFTCANE